MGSRGARIALAVAATAVLAGSAAAAMLLWHFQAGLGALGGPLLWSAGIALAAGLACGLALLGRAAGGRVGPGAGEVAAALFAAAVLGLCVNVVWMQPFHALKSGICMAWTVGALGAWLAARPRLAALAASRAARVTGIVVLQLCALVVLLEGGLRVMARLRPAQILALADGGAESFLAENRPAPRQMVWDLRTNAAGHFDEEFEVRGETPLVAAVGDSFSFGPVPHHFHFTTVCERLLPPVKVANLGVPSVGPPEYALMIEGEALPLKPDLVVVNLFIGNDITFMGSDRAGSPRWWRRLLDRDQYLLAHVPRRMLRLRREKALLRSEGGAGDVVPALESERMTPEQLVERTPWLADPLLETPGMSEEAFHRVERARAGLVCGPDDGPYEPFFRSLEALRRAAGDVPLAFLLIPDEFQVEDPLWERILKIGSDGESFDRDQPQRRIRAWCEERGVPYEDLLPRLRALPKYEDGYRHAYRLRDTHFNVLGNRVAGEGLAALVQRVLGLE